MEYGVGEPVGEDQDGIPIYRDYRVPKAVTRAGITATPDASKAPEIDGSWIAIVNHWRLVEAELAERGMALWDAATLRRPWPDVRAVIFSLLDSPTRLRAVLTRR